MSLINEALKRTRDASYQGGNASPVTLDNYRVSGHTDTSKTGPRSTVWVTLVIVVLAVSGAAIFALRMVMPTQQINEALRSDAVLPAPIPVPKPVVTPPSPKPEPVAVVPEPPPPPPPVPAAEPPKLTLQGITSQGNSREALINGYTFHEGDEIDGARVLAIESRRVRLQFDGKEIVLRMP